MKWEPIETAPKPDEYYGDEILLADSEGVYPGHWYKTSWYICDGAAFTKFEPTHWQPMPPPPEKPRK